MDRLSYWKKLKDQFNTVLNNDLDLSRYFKEIDTIRDQESLDLKQIERNDIFNVSFNVAHSKPRIDLYFKGSRYDLKKARNAYAGEYKKKYKDDGIEIFSDRNNSNNSGNSDCRCTFQMGSKISRTSEPSRCFFRHYLMSIMMMNTYVIY